MGAGGIFLTVLATGTLVVVMAAVPPPLDHHDPSPKVMDPEDPQCDVPDVTVVDGHPALIDTSDERYSMTLYFHAPEMFDALRIDVFTGRGRGVMWVPYSGDCILETDGWYEAWLQCERWEDSGYVSCFYKVKACRSYCILDRVSELIYFTVTAYGHSLWRYDPPPQGCRVHEVIDNINIGTLKCYDNPFDTSTSIRVASPQTTGVLTPATGALTPTTGSLTPTTGGLTSTTGTHTPTTSASPPTTGSLPPTTLSSSHITSAPPLTSAAPNRSFSGVEVLVAAVVQVG